MAELIINWIGWAGVFLLLLAYGLVLIFIGEAVAARAAA